MVTRASTTSVSSIAGSAAPYGPSDTTFEVVWDATASGCPSFADRGPVIGDTVYFYSSSNGTKYLARSGSSLTYIDAGGSVPNSARRILESPSGSYPDCTPIRFGYALNTGDPEGIPFRIRAYGSSYRLRSTSSGLRLQSSSLGSSTYRWHFNQACLEGDNCTTAF